MNKMMIKVLFSICILLLACTQSNAQYINRDSWTEWYGSTSIFGTKGTANYILKLGNDSTNKAVIMPRMIDTSIITSPVAGMAAYIIPLKDMYVYDGTKWKVLGGAGSLGVTSFSKFDGFGIISTVTNPTTTPLHNIRFDSATIFPLIRAMIPAFTVLDTTNKFVNSVIKINDSTIRVCKGLTCADLLIRGSALIDTSNRFLNSVIKINDSTLRVFKGSTSTDLLILGRSAIVMDTSNKWVNSVIKINDSVLRVFKGVNSTDLLILGRSAPAVLDTSNSFVNSVIRVNDSTVRVFKGTTSTDLLIRGNATNTGGAVGTIAQVLAIGDSTSHVYNFKDSGTMTFDNTIISYNLKPRNNGTVYGAAGINGTGSIFSQGYGYNPFVNANSRPNVIGLLWGYNGGFGAPIFSNEATWGVRTETAFQLAGGLSSEFHGVLPEFKSIDGRIRRLGSAYVNNATGFAAYTQMMNEYYQCRANTTGATDTVMTWTTETDYKWLPKTFGNWAIINSRTGAAYGMNTGIGGVTYALSSPTAASTQYFDFTSPIVVDQSATVGSSTSNAIKINMNRASTWAIEIASTSVAAGSTNRAIYWPGNTTGSIYAFDVRNQTATGKVIGSLRCDNQSTGQYEIFDAFSSIYFGMYYKGGTPDQGVFFGKNGDSSIKYWGTTGNVNHKYKTYLGGNTAPTAILHLVAGTATAATAPFKYTAGVNMTTPEAGAKEFDGTNEFITASTTRYTIAKTLTNTATLDFPSTGSATVSDLTVTVTGAALGDPVSIGVPNASITSTGSWSAWVSSADTVTVRYSTHATEDPASGLFRVSVIKY